jgi:hypothetical protein
MNWFADPKKQQAMSDKGYVIKWVTSKHGSLFNAWAPCGKHLEGCYDKDKCKAACIRHSLNENLEAERGTYG